MSVLLDSPSLLPGARAEEVVECSGEGVGRRPAQVIGDDDASTASEPHRPHPLHRSAVGADFWVVNLDEDLGPTGRCPAARRALARGAETVAEQAVAGGGEDSAGVGAADRADPVADEFTNPRRLLSATTPADQGPLCPVNPLLLTPGGG